MNEEQIALARRAMACKGWKWLPGMLCIWPNGNEFRVAQVNGIDGYHDLPNYPAGGWGDEYPDRTTGIPDLTDPATLGCVLALVREAWGNPHASVWYDSPIWHHGARWAWHALDQSRVDYDTEAHALVDALHYASVHRTVRGGAQ